MGILTDGGTVGRDCTHNSGTNGAEESPASQSDSVSAPGLTTGLHAEVWPSVGNVAKTQLRAKQIPAELSGLRYITSSKESVKSNEDKIRWKLQLD